ncbi:MAG: tRNA 2-thiocytidine biosynthesis TtcA family protein [Candidatus Aenigmatarchaeota archaeon]
MEINDYKRKIFRTIEKFKLIEEKDKVFVAISGGKDSSAALSLLKEYIEEKNISAEIYAYHINLGFGYSYELQKDVEKIANVIKVELFITDVKKEFNLDILKISKITKRPICSICGLVKRYLMNKIPRELGATKLATGHHAFDFLINYYKNIIHSNFDWNFKILPKLKSEHPKQLTKIRPLIFAIPDENKKYCEIKKIPITSISCPYSPKYCYYLAKNEDSKIFEFLNFNEKNFKNFNINFLKGLVNFNKKYYKKIKVKEEFRECKICKEVTNQEICAFCKLTKNFA